MEQEQSGGDDADILAQLDTYPWDEDEEFQAGLSAILGSATDPAQIQELTLRARCFYISRMRSIAIDFDTYKAHIKSQSNSEASVGTGISTIKDEIQATSGPVDEVLENPSYPTTFAEIVKLITEGKDIPGIKDIPPTVLHGQTTISNKTKRRKPWEKDETVESGTFGDRRDETIQQEMLE